MFSNVFMEWIDIIKFTLYGAAFRNHQINIILSNFFGFGHLFYMTTFFIKVLAIWYQRIFYRLQNILYVLVVPSLPLRPGSRRGPLPAALWP